jgi:hypothetical protein
MLKFTLAYLSGAATVAAAVYAAGGRATLASFVLGILFAAALLAAILSSARRIKRAARLMLRFAFALDRTSAAYKPVKPRRRRAARPGSVAVPAAAPADPRQTDLVSALKNFGMPIAQARAAAAAAIAAQPAADLVTLIRIAVNEKAAA